MLNRFCPGCGRRCYLDETKCERGAEYAKTGVLPPRKPKPDGGYGGKKHSEHMMKYRALPEADKLVWSIQDMADTIRRQEAKAQDDTGALHSEMFDCLREEDRALFLMYMEKVWHSWRHRYAEGTESEKTQKED